MEKILAKKSQQRKIGLAASRVAVIGNYMLRRPNHSTIEVIAPKEEEEEEEEWTRSVKNKRGIRHKKSI